MMVLGEKELKWFDIPFGGCYTGIINKYNLEVPYVSPV